MVTKTAVLDDGASGDTRNVPKALLDRETLTADDRMASIACGGVDNRPLVEAPVSPGRPLAPPPFGQSMARLMKGELGQSIGMSLGKGTGVQVLTRPASAMARTSAGGSPAASKDDSPSNGTPVRTRPASAKPAAQSSPTARKIKRERPGSAHAAETTHAPVGAFSPTRSQPWHPSSATSSAGMHERLDDGDVLSRITGEGSPSVSLRRLGRSSRHPSSAANPTCEPVRLGDFSHCVRIPTGPPEVSLATGNHAGNREAESFADRSSSSERFAGERDGGERDETESFVDRRVAPPPSAARVRPKGNDAALLSGALVRDRGDDAVLKRLEIDAESAMDKENSDGEMQAAMRAFESLHGTASEAARRLQGDELAAAQRFVYFACNRMGSLLHDMGNLSEARVWHRRHLASRDPCDKCVALCNLGLCMPRGKDALETLSRCTAMFDPMSPDYAGYASSAPTVTIRAAVIALLRLARDRMSIAGPNPEAGSADLEAAERYLDRAGTLARRIPPSHGGSALLAAVSWELSGLYGFGAVDGDERDAASGECFDIAVSLVEPIEAAGAAIARGESLAVKGRYERALESLERGREIALDGIGPKTGPDMTARLRAAARRAMCGIGVAKAQIAFSSLTLSAAHASPGSNAHLPLTTDRCNVRPASASNPGAKE